MPAVWLRTDRLCHPPFSVLSSSLVFFLWIRKHNMAVQASGVVEPCRHSKDFLQSRGLPEIPHSSVRNCGSLPATRPEWRPGSAKASHAAKSLITRRSPRAFRTLNQHRRFFWLRPNSLAGAVSAENTTGKNFRRNFQQFRHCTTVPRVFQARTATAEDFGPGNISENPLP